MKKEEVPGINGYSAVTQRFIDATLGLKFETLHRDFLQFIPKEPCQILDIGAGIGRDASILSKMGHSVKAVEPADELRFAGKRLFYEPSMEWIDDCLPKLEVVGSQPEQFDFILVSGVWHHLDQEEQLCSMERIAYLLKINGILAITLRHGPAGVGGHVFSTNGQQTVKQAEQYGLTTRLFLGNKPSLMQNKKGVSWTKLVFQKTTG